MVSVMMPERDTRLGLLLLVLLNAVPVAGAPKSPSPSNLEGSGATTQRPRFTT